MSRVVSATEEPGRGSREEAKRETRKALIQAGLAEFGERGLDVPSLDAICARAGFTRGAFYVHVRDRDEFIVAVMEEVLGAFLDATIAVEAGAGGLEQTVRRYVAALGAWLRGDAPLLGGIAPRAPHEDLQFHRFLEACARSPRVRERFASLLTEAVRRVVRAAREGQAARSVRTDVAAEQLGTLLVVLAVGAVNALEVGLEIDAESAGEAVLTLLAGGPAAEPTAS